ncbi:ABC transporter ATP-binding protein [Fodinisporobacter ferrooxydans]|uniref:ABC transporter ATP-binding protein n=1 Tax=Fodinisporobacter ferrooxydans TaxID=2901836 RepID=A0ABY4CFD1_9BACL|nr:ABC transporter ATP-binding protein [Alicyclobacillaceae bacterium MYW30-H2]
MADEVVLNVENLSVVFEKTGHEVTALRNISFQLHRAEILGLVGESGCGKSLTSLSIMRLLAPNTRITDGTVQIDGVPVTQLTESEMRKIRGNIMSMIFQEPMTALNPLLPIGRQIEETLLLHRNMKRLKRRQRVIQLLHSVGIPEPEIRYNQFPFELSGGMRQRVMIALALACEPKVVIADEPTTALDVTIQAQILDLLKHIRGTYQTSILLITHDMGVIADAADRVAVMYAGQIVEIATVDHLFERPAHPYTIGLLQSIPSLFGEHKKELYSIFGSVPDLSRLPSGCPFQSRCTHVSEICRTENPTLKPIENNHMVACWHVIPKGSVLHG